MSCQPKQPGMTSTVGRAAELAEQVALRQLASTSSRCETPSNTDLGAKGVEIQPQLAQLKPSDWAVRLLEPCAARSMPSR